MWIKEEINGIQVRRVGCELSPRRTYNSMLAAQVLVSTGGSFSFVPGMIKGKRFVSPTLLGDVSEYRHKKVLIDYHDRFKVPSCIELYSLNINPSPPNFGIRLGYP